MIAKIDRDGCISCGMCVEICPEVFHMGDDGLADVHQNCLLYTSPSPRD